ncbi:hypothetical protein HPB51_012427 [Rhipicephalus microplus]|uniref:Uncharacterized protein n=1 Tax=Rhipicephalus microplus TaxID=6941 RepID=A0A9J6E9H6_RHIMP|nr:hypothetical protein HPB51_012427 [Rhipicephalus microplus]
MKSWARPGYKEETVSSFGCGLVQRDKDAFKGTYNQDVEVPARGPEDEVARLIHSESHRGTLPSEPVYYGNIPFPPASINEGPDVSLCVRDELTLLLTTHDRSSLMNPRRAQPSHKQADQPGSPRSKRGQAGGGTKADVRNNKSEIRDMANAQRVFILEISAVSVNAAQKNVT